jgi:hypothetical protein
VVDETRPKSQPSFDAIASLPYAPGIALDRPGVTTVESDSTHSAKWTAVPPTNPDRARKGDLPWRSDTPVPSGIGFEGFTTGRDETGTPRLPSGPVAARSPRRR